MRQGRTLAYVALGTVCLLWGTTYLAIRIGIETIPPLLMTGLRFTVAGAVLLAISALRRQPIPRDRKTLANLAFSGFCMIGVGVLTVVWAERWVPSGMTALLVATNPFWMAIVERFRGQRVSKASIGGMLVGFIGVALLVMPSGGTSRLDLRLVGGALLLQVGVIAWQIGTVRTKYYSTGVPPLVSAGWQMLFGGLLLDVGGVLAGEVSRFLLTPRTFAAMLYLTIFGAIIGYGAYVYALAHLPTRTTSLYAYVNPVVAVILGWAILHERLTGVSIVGMAIILLGVAIVQGGGWKARTATGVGGESSVPEKAA